MRVTFIRHAEKEETGEDPLLTKKGIRQAKHLAKRLKKEKFDEFYCSNMNRAKQTADIISKKIRMRPKIEDSLDEFKSEAVKKERKKWSKREKIHYNKLISFLKGITKNPEEDKSILIVAHGITNRIILSYFFDLNIRKLVQFRQKESAINFMYWAEKFKNWRLRKWNDNNHVPKRLRDNEFSY